MSLSAVPTDSQDDDEVLTNGRVCRDRWNTRHLGRIGMALQV
jgi:hypothetical protein